MPEIVILGCGFTGIRVAHQLITEGHSVTCINRQPVSLQGARCLAWDEAARAVPNGALVLYSIPATELTHTALEILKDKRTERVVYLSTTGVYGSTVSVDEHTPARPESDKDRARLATEHAIQAGPWTALILRPAAIYGPHRGVHTGARAGVYRPPPGGDRLVSRIHVKDLAALALAGLTNQVTGAWPIADEEPSPSRAVAEYAFDLLGVPFRTESRAASARDEAKSGRSVDGSAYRRAINYRLRYPTYREGVPQCLAEEDN